MLLRDAMLSRLGRLVAALPRLAAGDEIAGSEDPG
jgi:hypothetical protein